MSKLVLVVFLVACGSPQKPPTCPVCTAQEPEPSKPTVPTGDADAPSSPELPPGVELATTAQLNMERGREAAAAKNWPAAHAYLDHVIAQFPLSELVHDAELALAELQVTEQPVIGSELDTQLYCQFIQHHPFHPLVENGELACRINKLQGSACVPKQTVPARYCRASYCKSAEAAKRPECK